VTTGRMPADALAAFPHAAVASVDNDARSVTRTALRHLMSAGYRHPGLLTSGETASFFRDCVAEARAWAAEHGETPRIARLRQDNESSARRALSALLDRYPDTDAIFTTSEVGAIGCVTVVAARGHRVPDDFGIVAGTDTSMLKHFSPSITAIDLHPGQLGRTAVEQLLGLRSGARAGGTPPSSTVVPHTLRRRDSTRRAGSASTARVSP
jgi:LacI family gluconate utilization system Gnt-I transcriptional repressor